MLQPPSMGQPGGIPGQAMFLSAQLLQQQQQQQRQQQQEPQPQQQQQQQQPQQQMNVSQSAGNAQLQIQQALMLIQQNEEQIRLLQQQTAVLKRVVQENQRLVEGTSSAATTGPAATTPSPSNANPSPSAPTAPQTGYNGTSSILNDVSKQDKLFHLLSQYFRKHEVTAAPEAAISKVVDWTKTHGFEALNQKLQQKNGESFNEFVLSMINEQRGGSMGQQQQPQPQPQRMTRQPQQMNSQQQQQPQQQQQRLPQAPRAQPPQAKLPTSPPQQQPQQPRQQQQQQPPQQQQPQMSLQGAMNTVQDQGQGQQRNGGHMSGQPGGGLNPAQLQQINMQASQGHPNFGNLPGQQLMAQQAFMHLMHQNNAGAQGGNPKQGNPLYAIPLSFLGQQQQSPGNTPANLYARMNMPPNPNDVNMYTQQQLPFQNLNGTQNNSG